MAETNEQTIEGLQKELAAAKITIEELTKRGADAESILDEQAHQINELDAQLAALATAPEAVPVFTLGKKQYRVSAPKFIFEGETYGRAELLKNKELQAKLVTAGVGFVTEIEK